MGTEAAPQSNVSSFEEQHLTNGNSFEIDNTTFSHNTAFVNGIQIHYVIGGHGDPVVLLHGWPNHDTNASNYACFGQELHRNRTRSPGIWRFFETRYGL